MNTEKEPEDVMDKFVWKKSYTWVLLLNAGYVVMFYYLMKTFA